MPQDNTQDRQTQATGAHPPTASAQPQGAASSAPEAGSNRPQPEKMHPRAHPRMPMVRNILVVELNDRGEPAASVEGQSIDISRGGLAFCSRRLFLTGRRLLVEIPKAGERIPTFLYGVVRHSRYVPGRGHQVGMELEPLPETQVILEWIADRVRATA